MRDQDRRNRATTAQQHNTVNKNTNAYYCKQSKWTVQKQCVYMVVHEYGLNSVIGVVIISIHYGESGNNVDRT